MYSDVYILFAFMGFIIGSFVLFFTINVSKARLETRKNTEVYVIDLPPRYSEVEPPPYDWVLKHHYLEDYSSKMHMTLNLSTVMTVKRVFFHLANKLEHLFVSWRINNAPPVML
ncbi:hypothetical protein LOAG_16360 [Loa loa]|uniref:Uncharacterized protein n=1 Tax=Loa loa TaxID=7209 RepID=A0A1S0UPG6_LOALO|nr:hypothetical protein LOAG_16360 [Loa loa]EJD76784.1 hypothetical protein LOAG_16360 [Loa loa]